MKNITLKGKMIIFKTLALSKIVCLTLITSFSEQLIEEIQRITKELTSNNLTSTIKHETLCNFFEEGDLKNVEINSKIPIFSCSWVKQLYDDKWKLTPHHFTIYTFGINFKFHSNLTTQTFLHLFHFINKFSVTGARTSSVNVPSYILSQPILYNKNIKMKNKLNYVEEFAKQNTLFLYDLFNTENEFKTWDEIKTNYELSNKSYFKWTQIFSSICKT